MSGPALSLMEQLAMTLASVCVCRHLLTAHDDHGCTRCECASFDRRTEHDAIVLTVMADRSRL